MTAFQVLPLGRINYRKAHQIMQDILSQRIAEQIPDTLLLCEHDPVYTLGRRRSSVANILDVGGIPIEQIERGGDITFHGHGQLVGYPILKLPDQRRDLHAYLRFIENFWIDFLQSKEIAAETDPRNTGVWVKGKKMVAIGISCRRWVSWHGFACNHSIDLDYFQRINPCGLDSSLVTRLQNHLADALSFENLHNEIAAAFPPAWFKWKELA